MLQGLDFDGVRTSFEVNAMGPLRCVQALLPSLKKGSKVIVGSIVEQMTWLSRRTSI